MIDEELVPVEELLLLSSPREEHVRSESALFAEEEKKTIKTEIAIFKDRLLKSYRWYIAMADNENIKADIRIKAQQDALEVAYTLLKLEMEGPRIIEEVRRFLEKLHQNSR